MNSRKLVIVLGITIILIASGVYFLVGNEETVKPADESAVVTIESMALNEKQVKVIDDEKKIEEFTEDMVQTEDVLLEQSEVDVLTEEDYTRISELYKQIAGVGLSKEEVDELARKISAMGEDEILLTLKLATDLFDTYQLDVDWSGTEIISSEAVIGETTEGR